MKQVVAVGLAHSLRCLPGFPALHALGEAASSVHAEVASEGRLTFNVYRTGKWVLTPYAFLEIYIRPIELYVRV